MPSSRLAPARSCPLLKRLHFETGFWEFYGPCVALFAGLSVKSAFAVKPTIVKLEHRALEPNQICLR